jgi:hypothetical protein
MEDLEHRYGWLLEAFVRRASGDVGVFVVSKYGRREASSRKGDLATVGPLETYAVRISQLAEVAGARCGFGRCHQVVMSVRATARSSSFPSATALSSPSWRPVLISDSLPLRRSDWSND